MLCIGPKVGQVVRIAEPMDNPSVFGLKQRPIKA